MAEDREVVRVTYRDLEQIAQRNKVHSPDYDTEAVSSSRGSHAGKKSKRPERSIYRPGVSRLRKTSESQEDSINTCLTDSTTCDSQVGINQICNYIDGLTLQEDISADVEETQRPLKENKPRRKRPDIKIYVPKGKLLEKDEDQSADPSPQYGIDEDISPEFHLSEEENIQGRSLHQRKVNVVKAKDKKMCITVLNSESPVTASPEEGNHSEEEKAPLKTMIFERSGLALSSTNNPKGDYLKNVESFNEKIFKPKENYSSEKAHKHFNKNLNGSQFSRDNTGTKLTSAYASSENSGKSLEVESSDISSKPPLSGQNSPSGKSRRYSLAKRKQRNSKQGNGNDNSREDLTKDAAASNSELDSDTALDELENMTPVVLDWSEEVEREIGEGEVDLLENTNKLQSCSIQMKSSSQKINSKKKAVDNRPRKFENVQDRVVNKKPNQDTKNQTGHKPQRRSSFDSASWSKQDQTYFDHSDAESDITDHRKKRSGRKRERKRTRSGPKDHLEGMGLRVTIDRNERQVEVKDQNDRRRRPPEYHSSRERLSSDSDFIHSPKGGGILHLAQNTDTQQQRRGDRHRRSSGSHQSNENLQTRKDSRGGPRNSRDNVRGNSSGQRTLFDPSNPSKPIVIQSTSLKLQFSDSKGSPPVKQAQYDPYNPSSFSGGFVPGYGRGYSASQFAPPAPYNASGEQVYYGYPGSFHESSSCGDDTYAKDPYYHSGNDTDYVIGGMSRSQCRAMADHILREAAPLDAQLSNILSRRIHRDGERLLNTLRHDLKNKYEQVILLDPDLANKHNVEQLLWKNVFYQVIEIYRRHLMENHEEDTTVDMLQLLDEATLFYESLLQKLQHTYSFQLDLFLEVSHPPPENLSRAVKLALLSSQRTMICLGDVARYREQAHGKMNYGKARSWYMKAQQIAPKNGRPYNQLAILALYTKRKLDAVYYYMRSLAASNPFLTARESLMSLFDEARKKAEATEAKKQEDREKLKTWRKRRQKEGPRIEIWVSADGRSETGEIAENYEEDLSHMTPVELNKRLSLSFLNSHGKLFTKIGMETFDDVCSQLLQEYKAVLTHHPVIIANNRLLQLTAMNMFAVDNTALKAGERIEDNCRSLLQENAVQQGLDMFGVLVSRFTQLLRAHIDTKDYPIKLFNDDIHEVVASIKVWSDWMLCHPTLWNPAPNLKDPDSSFKIDVWKEAAEMFNVLKEVDITHVKLYKNKKEGCDPVILEEDTSLAGFVPLLSAPSEPMFVHATVEKHIAKDCLRIQKLQTFGDYLCGIEPPMLAYSVETRKYYSIASSVDCSSDGSKGKGSNSEIDDVIIESEVSEEGSDVEDAGENGLQELRAKKEQLQRQLDEQTKKKENVEAILEKHRHRAMELEICPVFLVPDTNCFINYMAGMQKLLRSQKFTLVVPLVVINELDGLTKGGSGGHPHDVAHHQHMTRVSNHAKQAVQLLESEFGKRNPHLKALTSKGSTLETISFRSEEADNAGINDDLILSCCLHYCKDRAKDFMPRNKDTPIRLHRDVVLLTDDRNLRLKAHTRNVPVKDVPSFLKWAKIT